MSKQIQRRRGSAANHNGFTGAAGEITIDTTNWRPVVHDGTSNGGISGLKMADVFTNGFPRLSNLVDGNQHLDSNISQTFLQFLGDTNTSKIILNETGITLTNGESAQNDHLQTHQYPGEVGNQNTILFDGGTITPTASTSLALLSGANIYLGRRTVTSLSTNGFPHIPTVSGVPNATPTTIAGYAPFVFNTGNSRVYFFNPTGKWWYAQLTST